MRGLLQLLKKTWTGEMTVPPSITKSELKLLKEQLEEVKIKSLGNSDVSQKAIQESMQVTFTRQNI